MDEANRKPNEDDVQTDAVADAQKPDAASVPDTGGEADAAHNSEADAQAEPNPEPELTPRQARLKAREERRARRAERLAQEAKSTGDDDGGKGPAGKSAPDEDTESDFGDPDAPKEPLEKSRKRRDVLTAARRQVERIRKEKETTDPASQPGEPGLLVTSAPGNLSRQQRGALQQAPDRPLTEYEREQEIMQIQRELVQRRRRRWTLMWLRLAFFIVLPTFLVGNYFYNHATPFYATKSAFVIERGGVPSTMVGSGGLFSGTALVTARESISVQEFLTSREAMRILDDELGILNRFSNPAIDRIQRLEPDASENAAYSLYQDRVLVGFDSTEGIIRLETIAADRQTAQRMAERLIELAEERVDKMSSRTRRDALATTQEALAEANRLVDEQYEKVLKLQQDLGIFSADLEVELVLGMISTLAGQAEERRLRLAALLDNPRPNAAQVRVLEAEIARLEESIEAQRSQLLQQQSDQESLARVSVELQRAEADLELALAARILAIETNAAAQSQADQQTLYLSPVVNPVLPEVPNYPRAFEYTILSFIIFFAIYMVASLTISILREQMSYGTHT